MPTSIIEATDRNTPHNPVDHSVIFEKISGLNWLPSRIPSIATIKFRKIFGTAI